MSSSSASTAYITKARRVLQTLRGGVGEGDVAAAILHTFLVVSENEGKTVNELGDLVGATRTTISRHLLDLSESLRNGDEGYRLLTRMVNPTDRRSVVFTVSPKGRRLLNSLRDVMED